MTFKWWSPFMVFIKVMTSNSVGLWPQNGDCHLWCKLIRWSPPKLENNRNVDRHLCDLFLLNEEIALKKIIYHQTSNMRHQFPKLKCFSSCIVVAIEARCLVENEDVVGAAPTGDAPTTSEWSTILLRAKVQLVLRVWQYVTGQDADHNTAWQWSPDADDVKFTRAMASQMKWMEGNDLPLEITGHKFVTNLGICLNISHWDNVLKTVFGHGQSS